HLARIGCGVHVRHLHPHHSAVEHLEDVLGAAAHGSRDRGDAARLGRHRHELDALQRERAVLAIEQHPVEARGGDHLDDLRRGDHHGDAEGRLARGELFLHQVLFHVCSSRKRITSSGVFRAVRPMRPERSNISWAAEVISGSTPRPRSTSATCSTSWPRRSWAPECERTQLRATFSNGWLAKSVVTSFHRSARIPPRSAATRNSSSSASMPLEKTLRNILNIDALPISSL